METAGMGDKNDFGSDDHVVMVSHGFRWLE